MKQKSTIEPVQANAASTQRVNNRGVDRQETVWKGDSTSFERADDIEGMAGANEQQAGNVEQINKTVQQLTNN
jgi:hypothetical protein